MLVNVEKCVDFFFFPSGMHAVKSSLPSLNRSGERSPFNFYLYSIFQVDFFSQFILLFSRKLYTKVYKYTNKNLSLFLFSFVVQPSYPRKKFNLLNDFPEKCTFSRKTLQMKSSIKFIENQVNNHKTDRS